MSLSISTTNVQPTTAPIRSWTALEPRHRIWALHAVAIVLSFALMWSPASAETLQTALLRAMESNPQFLAARSALQAVHEEVNFARSGYRPTLAVDATATQSKLDDENIAVAKIGVQLDQALVAAYSLIKQV